MNIKNLLWQYARSNIPEGQILPRWALAVRAVLFPLQFFYWRMSGHIGYQWDRDVWLIDGICFSGSSLCNLAASNGRIYEFLIQGDVLIIQEVIQRYNPNATNATRP